MRTKIRFFLLIAAFLLADVAALASEAPPRIGADAALRLLLKGNRSFVSNRLTVRESSTPARRRALVPGQRPFAVILSCSDSRVPPEVIFNKGLGEIFVVRDAGNIPDPIVIGSIEYAVEHLGASLIMVLGHTRCGAVKAAVDATGREDENIGAIIEKIAPAVRLAQKKITGSNNPKLLEAAIDANIKLSARSLLKKSPLIQSLVASGKVRIVCAKYDLDSGSVNLMSCKAN
ncbi:MAG: carbonic anhydrase [Syntrophobacteraceae bacterium]|nr:carbonic anhydrase [Syntrophobacteraceae bacterium]